MNSYSKKKNLSYNWTKICEWIQTTRTERWRRIPIANIDSTANNNWQTQDSGVLNYSLFITVPSGWRICTILKIPRLLLLKLLTLNYACGLKLSLRSKFWTSPDKFICRNTLGIEGATWYTFFAHGWQTKKSDYSPWNLADSLLQKSQIPGRSPSNSPHSMTLQRLHGANCSLRLQKRCHWHSLASPGFKYESPINQPCCR